jgi:hypothetical protein
MSARYKVYFFSFKTYVFRHGKVGRGVRVVVGKGKSISPHLQGFQSV